MAIDYSNSNWSGYPQEFRNTLAGEQGYTDPWRRLLYGYFLQNEPIDDAQWRHLNLEVLNDYTISSGLSDSERILLYRSRIKPRLLAALKRYKANQSSADPILIKTLENFINNNDELIFDRVYNKGLERTDVTKAAGSEFKGAFDNDAAPHDVSGDLLFSTDLFDDLISNSTEGAIQDLAGLEQEAQTAQNKNNLLKALAGSQSPEGKAETPEISRQDLLNQRQCLLFSDLLNEGDSFKSFPLGWDYKNTNPSNINPFYGRILPVTPDSTQFDSNLLSNYCSNSSKVKEYFKELGKGKTSIYSALTWVYMNEKKELKETTIYKSRAKRIDAGIATDDAPNYNFEEIDIKFEGTNPSTARDDVLVTMTIKIDSFVGLDAIVARAAMGDGSFLEITVQDLITLPTVDTVERKEVKGNTTLISSYSPDYSRVRLKIWNDASDDSFSSLIVDLATIKHTMSRQNDATGGTTITIEYRGYFEQSLNMPYNDAFATEDTRVIREDNDKLLKALKDDGNCSKSLVKQVMRGNQEFTRLSIQQMLERGDFIKRLFDKNLIYTYTLVQNIEQLLGQNLDLSVNYINGFAKMSPKVGLVVKNVIDGTETIVVDPLTLINGDLSAPGDVSRAAARGVDNSRAITDARLLTGNPRDLRSGTLRTAFGFDDLTGGIENLAKYYSYFQNCVFLGDLMNLVVECLYDDSNPSEMREGLKQLNLKFIVGSVKVPNPKALLNSSPSNPPYLTINPLQIPIDLGFFIEWFHATYVKKGIGSYPVGMFIRDLVERLINDVLYETCFSVLLPDENPPQLRSTFFTDHNHGAKVPKSFKTRADGWFHPYDPFAEDLTASMNAPAREPMMQKKYNDTIETASNYCVIYQQFPSYFRQLRNSTGGKTLKDDPYTVTMYYGANLKDNNYCSNVTFTKTESDFLREARYFNSAAGTLSLLSNVYDLSFEFDGIKSNTHFYPGNIINFILTDWSGDATWRPGDSLGESDPHVKGSKAYVLGFGGYFIIKSVNYRLSVNQGADHFKIIISTKFLGTDVVSDGQTEPPEDTKLQDPNSCLDVANESAARVYGFIQDNNLDIDPGVSFFGTNTPQQEDDAQAERQREIEENRKQKNIDAITKYIKDNMSFSSDPVTVGIEIPADMKQLIKKDYPDAQKFIEVGEKYYVKDSKDKPTLWGSK